MPLTHFETRPLALRFVCVAAVGVVRGPALGVDAPHGPGLHSTCSTFLSNTPAPLTCKEVKLWITKLIVLFGETYAFKANSFDQDFCISLALAYD